MPDLNHWHVYPENDLAGHDTDHQEDCVCGPESRLEKDDQGADIWIYLHHALDGREHHERKAKPCTG